MSEKLASDQITQWRGTNALLSYFGQYLLLLLLLLPKRYSKALR